MNTPNFFAAPDYTPVVRMMAMQTRFAIETSQGLMKLAMMPWTGLPTGFGSICTPMGSVTVATRVVDPAPEPEAAPAETVEAEAVEVVEETVAAPKVAAEAPKAAPAVAPKPVAEAPKKAAPKPAAPKAAAPEAVAPKAEAPKPVEPKAVEPKAEKPVAKTEAPKAPEAKAQPAPVVAPTAAPVEDAVAMEKPKAISAPKGALDDLTVLNGVGPKLAEALNAEGIYTYKQIAGWTEANVAWIDENLPGVRGRASRNGWVAQAAELAG